MSRILIIKVIAVLAAILVARLLLFFIINHTSLISRDELHLYFAAFWNKDGLSQAGERIAFRDAGAYLQISECGYAAGSQNSAFYPLWPLVLKPIVTYVPTFAVPAISLALANIFSIAGGLLFFAWCCKCGGERCAWYALATQQCLPASFFFFLPFSESLFVFLFALLLWSLERRLVFLCAVCACLLSLTRPVGPLIAGGFLWWSVNNKGVRNVLPLAGCILGWISHLVCMKSFTGNFFESIAAQQLHINQPSLAYLLEPVRVFGAFFDVATFFGNTDALLDRLCFLAAIAALICCLRFSRLHFWMMMPVVIVPAATNLFLSYRRFSIVLLPCIMAISILVDESRRVRNCWYLCITTGIILQIFSMWRHMSCRWAG